MTDLVNHPPHYRTHPSGIECIEITELCSFTLGNAIKYIWRAWDKYSLVEDLAKARWYLRRALANGCSSVPPHRARLLLSQAINADLNGDRGLALSWIRNGSLEIAIDWINRIIGNDTTGGPPVTADAMHAIDLDVIENAHMIHSDRGSKPEPPLDQSWPDLIKLKWHAALTRSETGINVTVHLQPQEHPGDYYQITLSGPGWFTATVHTYRNAWIYLNGIGDGGAAAARKQQTAGGRR